MTGAYRIAALHTQPLRAPLRAPFVIATARMDTTRALLVRARLERQDGASAEGLGEAAALPPVTAEDLPELEQQAAHARAALVGRALEDSLLADLGIGSVLRSGLECAITDAIARIEGVPFATLLDPGARLPASLTTDITLPIAAPEIMASDARSFSARGFDCFKVKVGRALADDLRALAAVHQAVPGARLRLDANGGLEAGEALELLEAARRAGADIECFEQPCHRDDLEGLAEVQRAGGVPIIADESLRSLADLDQLVAARAVRGVNLKLVKLGGPRAAIEIGRRAREAGLTIMAGAMVETRLGLTAMAHVVAALGGVEHVDLDTAFLLAADPFTGGMSAEVQPQIRIGAEPGLGMRLTGA